MLELSNLPAAYRDVQTTMMYYWTVKYDGSEDQDIISYREELGTLRHHHIVIESLSPLLKNGASFALGRRISTEKTWRDLNDALVTYLQSQTAQDDKEQPTLGINIGAGNPVQRHALDFIRTFFPRDNRGIQDPRSAEGIVLRLQIPRRIILGLHSYTILLRAGDPWALLESSSHPGLPNMSVASTYDSYTAVRVKFPLHCQVSETTHPNNEACFVSSCKDYGIRSLKHVDNPRERHCAVHHFSPDENTYICPKRPKLVVCIVLVGGEQDVVDEVDQRDVWNPEL